MTHQMARGSQVAFAKAWLERQGIESQTVDVYSHIDSSLSYEENIKNLKRMLGMGGRSTKKATRDLSAAECDVAIGNYNAGFDHESTRDAYVCGEPNACDEERREKRTVAKTNAPPIYPPATLKKKDYKPAKTWGEFVKINKTQISKHTAGIKKWSAGIKDKKQGEKLFREEIRQYNMDITDIWSKTKATPSTVKKAAKRPVSERIQKITNNMPAGYEIRKWYYEDRLGNKHTAHAVMFKGEAVFGQNKTFKSLTDARKALKEHLSSERSREQNRKDRKQFEKYGYIGEWKGKIAATPLAPLVAATPMSLAMLGAGSVQAVTKPKRPARKGTAVKTTKAKGNPKKTAGTRKLTIAQKKRLVATGRITVKRGGKFITITK